MNTELPSTADLTRSLLDDLHFEDDQGLWEIVWRLNTLCPEVGQNDKIALARQVVFELLAGGQIELRKIAWPDHDGPLLDAQQVARLSHDDLPWYDPENCSDLLVQVNEPEA